MNTLKLYILVRKDLNPIYGCVQAGHAVAEFSLKNYRVFREWGNSTLVYLAVPDLRTLKLWLLKLERKDIFYVQFHEPDLDELTSIACINTGKIFRGLQLA